jgi:membrane protease YdiL (CAAX protease family)
VLPTALWLVIGLLALPVVAGPLRAGLLAILDRSGGSSTTPATYATPTAWVEAMAGQPATYLAHVLAIQIAMLLVALVPAALRGRGWRERIGWVAPVGGLGAAAAAAAGLAAIDLTTLGVILSTGAGEGQIPERLQALHAVRRVVPTGWWLALLGAGALLAPLAEESLFRGFLQRGLLRAWPPFLALGLTAVVFALVHGSALQLVTILPGAVWLGWVAWRSGSVVPSILAHGVGNALWLGLERAGTGPREALPGAAAGAAVAVGAALGSAAAAWAFERAMRRSGAGAPDDLWRAPSGSPARMDAGNL